MEKSSKMIPSMIKDQRLIQQRRQQIVEGAVRLFVEKGFHKTTTREIARECGLSIGTMYEYIQSKEDVLYLVCDFIHSELEKKLLETISVEDSGIVSLRKALTHLFRIMGEMRTSVLLIYQEVKSLPKEQMSHVLGREEEMTGIFAQILEKGRADGTIHIQADSVKLMAHNIMVLAQMWTFRYWSLGHQYDLETYTEHQIAFLLSKFD